jgi:hypothetical protein
MPTASVLSASSQPDMLFESDFNFRTISDNRDFEKGAAERDIFLRNLHPLGGLQFSPPSNSRAPAANDGDL